MLHKITLNVRHYTVMILINKVRPIRTFRPHVSTKTVLHYHEFSSSPCLLIISYLSATNRLSCPNITLFLKNSTYDLLINFFNCVLDFLEIKY